MSFMKKTYYICPYCFGKNEMYDVAFRCSTNDTKKCAYEKDGRLSEFLGVETLKPKAFLSDKKEERGIPKEAECPQCGEKSNTRLCPQCHSDLPPYIGEYDDLIFAVIGAKEAGKSHYISVLIDKIQKEISTAFKCSMNAINDDTIKRYRENFYNPVFRRGEVIQITRSAKADATVRKPLIYNLKFKNEGFLPLKKISKVVTIAFFDTAGEDLNDEETMKKVNQYICNSSGIIFLVDPLQLPEVRERLPQGTPLPEQNTEMQDLLARAVNVIRKAKGLRERDLIDIPMAVAFSKMDAVEPLLEGGSSIQYSSKHINTGMFDMSDYEDVSGEMRSRVRDWGGEDFDNQLGTNFKDFAYFGITALGCNPHHTNRINQFRPHRVEDPFLWLLWKHNLIKAKRRK